MKTVKASLLVTLFASLFLIACTGNSSGDKSNTTNQEEKIVETTEGIVKLNAPNKSKGKSLMQALSDRKSVREFKEKDISLADLSNLLWAANGINRPENSKRTAPSALNAQDVDVYVCMKEGAYLYDAKNNMLKKVSAEDLRPAVAGAQEFVKQAPVSLVLVSDISRFPGENAAINQMMGAMDTGIVSQNISLYCASVDLSTVPRASMDVDALKKALQLSDTQIPLMNHPIGYSK